MVQNGRNLEYVLNIEDKCTYSNVAFKKSNSQRWLFYFSDWVFLCKDKKCSALLKKWGSVTMMALRWVVKGCLLANVTVSSPSALAPILGNFQSESDSWADFALVGFFSPCLVHPQKHKRHKRKWFEREGKSIRMNFDLFKQHLSAMFTLLCCFH